jgi:arylsulfatase
MKRTLALMLALGCGNTPARSPDVVLLTVDTLRADHLGSYGGARDTSPQIDAFFSEAWIFERAYATAASTPPGTVSVLTGQLPDDHRVRQFYQQLPAGTKLLSEQLGRDYQTAGFVSNAVLADEAIGMADRFDHFDDYVNETLSASEAPFAVERRADDTTDAVLRWLTGERDPERPLFLWVHYMDPHGPYDPPAPYQGRFTHEGSRDVDEARIQPYQRRDGADDALDWIDRYDEEIAFVDQEIGRLLAGLELHLDLSRALVVLTADHGESLLERRVWFRHGFHVFEEILRVPLLVRAPSRTGRRVETPVSVIDVVPTVLAYVGTSGSAGEGVDLLGPLPPDRVLYAEAAAGRFQWRAAIQGAGKFIARVPSGSREIDRRAYVDLARDPLELKGAPWPDDTVAAEALAARIASDPDPGGRPVLRADELGQRLTSPKIDPRADDAALEKLRALGYVE